MKKIHKSEKFLLQLFLVNLRRENAAYATICKAKHKYILGKKNTKKIVQKFV